MTAVRENPLGIDATKKEGVADAILNIIYSRISGEGSFGEVVFGAPPSRRFVSGFLLPRRSIDDGDEVTSPIWISSHGLDFQVDKAARATTIRLQPAFCIYVRILPSEEDVKTRSDCRPVLRVRKDVADNARAQIRDALTKRWEPLKEVYQYHNKCPDWPRIKEEVQTEVYRRIGLLPPTVVPPQDDDNFAPHDGDGDPNVPADAVILTTDSHVELRDDLYETLDVPQKWLKLKLSLPELTLDPYAPPELRAAAIGAHEEAMTKAIRDRLVAWQCDEDAQTGGRLWGYGERTRVRPSQYRDWSKFLAEQRTRKSPPAIPDISVLWDIQVSPDWLDTTRLNVHVSLENHSKIPLSKTEEEPTVFGVSVTAELSRNMHRRLRLARVKPSYRYNQYLSYPAIGYNGGVAETNMDDRVVLRTTWTPRYNQPRIVPLAYDAVERNVRLLSEPDGLDTLPAISQAYAQWLKELPETVDCTRGLEDNAAAAELEYAEFSGHLEKWERERCAIASGIEILREAKRHWKGRGVQPDRRSAPFEAWLAMNEAMADYMNERLRLEQDTAQWRLFQLAFILANLPSLVSRMPEYQHLFDEDRDDSVTLLYFATGGGKSEAFFGLLLYALFLDRLRGKTFGVTAMLRYPLRLLTIQQAQRASKVLGKAELVRQKHGYTGEPFSIGFWVGSGGSPNRLTDRGVSDIPEIEQVTSSEASLVEESDRYATARKAWRKLPTCPFCNTETGLRRFPALGGTLGHICTSEACAWNRDGVKPLPFYIVDDDIYDNAPSVLLGTVDKLALIGHSARTIRRILGMFGTAPWQKEDSGRLYLPKPQELQAEPSRYGCRALFPAYEQGLRLFHDPYPSLLIQDEAHLLDEGLGTFAGLFESTLDAMFDGIYPALRNIAASTSDGNRRRAKVIAASATVSEPERQLEHLYQRQVPELQFPYPGPDIYRSFYAAPAEPIDDEPARIALRGPENLETRSPVARMYSAVMTNGRPHTSTTVAVLASFHLTVTELFDGLTSDDPKRQEAIREQLVEHLSNSPIRQVAVDKLRSASIDELATLVDLHRISLTYVTNKKGGDQIMAAEAEEVRKLHNAYGHKLDGLSTRLITGSVEQGEIQATVNDAQRRVKVGEPLPPITDVLRSIVATSAVSHGVDVEELNSMFFAGMPSDIAEYIQASSRVGRTHVGFCVLIPTPQRRRDRYVIEVFDVFHRFLERMVQPAAIDRWAENAVKRALPSIFQSCLCGVIAVRTFLEASDNEKHRWRANEAINDFASTMDRDFKAFASQITNFAELAIGLKERYAPQGEQFYRKLVQNRIKEMLDEMGLRGNRESSLKAFFEDKRDTLTKPMTSLRDVDQGGTIRLARKDDRGTTLISEEVREIMALIRNGYADEGDTE